MRLSEFIVQNADRIVDEWERFAETITPAAEHMDSVALRGNAKDMAVDVADVLKRVKEHRRLR